MQEEASGRGAGGDQILLVNIGGNIVLNDGHLPKGWREGAFLLCSANTGGRRGQCRTRSSEPDCDQSRETVSPPFTHAHLKGEASVKVAPFRSVAGFPASWVTLLFCEPHLRHYWTRINLVCWRSAKAWVSAPLRPLCASAECKTPGLGFAGGWTECVWWPCSRLFCFLFLLLLCE